MRKASFVFMVIVILAIAGGVGYIAYSGTHRLEHYRDYVTTAGEIERKYSGMGPEHVDYAEFIASDKNIGKFEVWYPSRIKDSEEPYPAVIFANGSGMRASRYQSFFEHLASWGFVVVGNEDKNTHDGISVAKTYDFLINKNNEENGAFSGKINVEKIGLGGYSEGGIAVYRIAEERPEAFAALYTVSATSPYWAAQKGWSYSTSFIWSPILVVAGTGAQETGNAESIDVNPQNRAGVIQGKSPLWGLNKSYDELPESTVKMVARKQNTDHDTSYQEFDGYMTAWFVYLLQDNEEAGKAFFGENTELKNNTLYTDVRNDEDEFVNFNIAISEEGPTRESTFIIYQNQTGHKYLYNSGYAIERYDAENDEWHELERNYASYPDQFREIAPGEELKFLLDWHTIYGSLPDGKYRIVKEFTRVAHIVERHKIVREEPVETGEGEEGTEPDEAESGENSEQAEEPVVEEPEYEEVEKDVPTIKMRKTVEFEFGVPVPPESEENNEDDQKTE